MGGPGAPGGWSYSTRRMGGYDADSWVVARDRGGGPRVSKQFRVVLRDGPNTREDYEEYCRELGLGGRDPPESSHRYEVIPDGLLTPVWFFADHDCKGPEDGLPSPEEFEERVLRLHEAYFRLGPGARGVTIFACRSHRHGKRSVHVKVSLKTTLRVSRMHAEALCAAAGPDEAVRPDLSVYCSRLQQIRAVRNSKMRVRGSAKLPIRSHDAPDLPCRHLVRWSHLDDCPALASAPDTPGDAPPRRAPAEESRPECAALVREALAACGASRLLGPAFSPEACRLEDTRFDPATKRITSYLDGSWRHGGDVVCPFAGRTHTSNRSVVQVSPCHVAPGHGTVAFICLSPACRGKRAAFAYSIGGRGSILRAS